MKRLILGIFAVVAFVFPGNILGSEWEADLISKGWVKLTHKELLENRLMDVTLKGFGKHKGKITYIDSSGLKMFFKWEAGSFTDKGIREFKDSEICNIWNKINKGKSYCFPTHRTVWEKEKLRAVYKITGQEVYIYTIEKGNIENLH